MISSKNGNRSDHSITSSPLRESSELASRYGRTQLVINPQAMKLSGHSLENLAEPYRNSEIIDDLSYEELLQVVQKLPHHYRPVFNLAVIDGFKHGEIAFILDISPGTSRAYPSRAKMILQDMLQGKKYV